jgi:subtilisin family serine protease
VVSQGVAVTGADRFQQSSAYHFPPEEKVRVGVLDVGFLGYQSLVGSELPRDITTQTFSSGGLNGSGLDSIARQHGTAVAEIVFDMAPDAAMLLTNIDTLFAHSQATSWLLSNGANVISSSLSWFNVGPGDGTGPVNFDVERATGSGAAWVTSAGNMAQRHWDGAFRDPDNDGWNNFDGSSETNPALLAADGSLTVFLNWDDWFTTNQDYDLYIFFECSESAGAAYPCDGDSDSLPAADRPLVLAGISRNPQEGTEAPVEQVTVTAGDEPVVAHVAIRKVDASRSAQLETFFVGDIVTTPAFVVPEGSITIPADTESAVAVGATYWSDDSLEPFSSWGPTADGRRKPDIVAPDGVITVTYGPLSFYGTSAATPHVAGAIALLKSRAGLYSYDQIVRILYGRALDLGPSGGDNRYGAGRLSIDP